MNGAHTERIVRASFDLHKELMTTKYKHDQDPVALLTEFEKIAENLAHRWEPVPVQTVLNPFLIFLPDSVFRAVRELFAD